MASGSFLAMERGTLPPPMGLDLDSIGYRVTPFLGESRRSKLVLHCKVEYLTSEGWQMLGGIEAPSLSSRTLRGLIRRALAPDE